MRFALSIIILFRVISWQIDHLSPRFSSTQNELLSSVNQQFISNGIHEFDMPLSTCRSGHNINQIVEHKRNSSKKNYTEVAFNQLSPFCITRNNKKLIIADFSTISCNKLYLLNHTLEI